MSMRAIERPAERWEAGEWSWIIFGGLSGSIIQFIISRFFFLHLPVSLSVCLSPWKLLALKLLVDLSSQQELTESHRFVRQLRNQMVRLIKWEKTKVNLFLGLFFSQDFSFFPSPSLSSHSPLPVIPSCFLPSFLPDCLPRLSSRANRLYLIHLVPRKGKIDARKLRGSLLRCPRVDAELGARPSVLEGIRNASQAVE